MASALSRQLAELNASLSEMCRKRHSYLRGRAALHAHIERSLPAIAMVFAVLLPTFAAISSVAAQQTLSAPVRIGSAQEAVLERQAFDARLHITEGLDAFAIEDLGVQLTFADADGEPMTASSDPDHPTALFFVDLESVNGIDGDPIVGSGASDEARGSELPRAYDPRPRRRCQELSSMLSRDALRRQDGERGRV